MSHPEFWGGSCFFIAHAGTQQPDTKPNARWRDGFSLVPSIPVGCADKPNAALVSFDQAL